MVQGSKITVGFLGEILVDVVATPTKHHHGPNSPDLVARLGGAPINAAVVASQLSSDVASYPICSMGDDWLGDFLYAELRKFPVKMDMVQRVPTRNTSVAFYPLDASGEQIWSEYHRDADLEILDPAAQLPRLGELDGLGFGSPTLAREETAQRLSFAIDRLPSCAVAFDVNYRPSMWSDPATFRRVVSNWMSRVHLIKCNLSEAKLLVGTDGTPESTLRALHLANDQIVFLTLGDEGSMLRQGANLATLHTGRIEGNPIGAGDAFFAAVLTGLTLAKKKSWPGSSLFQSLVKIGEFGNRCGGIANLHRGACSTEVTSRYAEAYVRALESFFT
jgi:sugar/nucleoside kinase (ribokinase family)